MTSTADTLTLPFPGLDILSEVWATARRLGERVGVLATPGERKLHAVAHRVRYEVVEPLLRSRTVEDFEGHLDSLADSRFVQDLLSLIDDEDVRPIYERNTRAGLEPLLKSVAAEAGPWKKQAQEAISEAVRILEALRGCLLLLEPALAGEVAWNAALSEAKRSNFVPPLLNTSMALLLSTIAIGTGAPTTDEIARTCILQCRREMWKLAASMMSAVPDDLVAAYLPELVPNRQA